MKTSGMKHQLEALKRMKGHKEYYALFMEQGTGKTWTLLANAERLYSQGTIDAVLVIAPNGVHTNWVRREIPEHMDGHIIARYWSSGAGVKQAKWTDEIMQVRRDNEPVPLRILAMSIDAAVTKSGYAFAEKFLNTFKTMIILDESSRIKNPDAKRTKAMYKLRSKAVCARIASGTPITNSPVDVFAQMEFLSCGLLGTTSYRSFVAEYAEVLSENHPFVKRMTEKNPKIKFAQIIAKNADGSPIWRNLDKLSKLLEPHSYRILKKDCLDLPKKIYKTITFELTSKQQQIYSKLKNELRIDLNDESVLTVKELAAIVKLQQITSGFVNTPFGVKYLSDENPRLKALSDAIEDVCGKFIIWARFREEITAIVKMLAAAKIECVEYHGGINRDEREVAVDAFQNGSVRAFVGQPKSGGIGLTLTAAETVFYYSNDYNLETRLQSEDRAHRIGTKNNVVYIDLAAIDTIDEKITANLQRKKITAAVILDNTEA